MRTAPQKFIEFSDLWESGVDLDLAWLKHSPTVEPFDLVALRTHPDNDDGIRSNPRYALLGEWLPPTFELRQTKLRDTIDELRHYLLSLLFEGNLWAIGNLACKARLDAKVLIPREYFFYPREQGSALKRIDWKHGSLCAEGKRFSDIRVALPLSAREESRGRLWPPGNAPVSESRLD
jgi:hypothetical protein